MEKIIFLAVVFCLLAGLIGCASAPQYAENSEIPWEIFYSATQKNSVFRKMPHSFFIEAHIRLSSYGYPYFLIFYQTDSKPVSISPGAYSYGYEIKDIENKLRLEPNKTYKIKILKREIQGSQTFLISHIDGVPSATEIKASEQREQQIAREERERVAAEERQQREAERQQPRFSPEGQEYIKRTLIQAVGESRNQASRGKTLFFETKSTRLRSTGVAGQYLVDEFMADGNVIFEFYGRIPALSIDIASAIEIFNGYGHVILYRVEISQLGVATFKIDSFRE